MGVGRNAEEEVETKYQSLFEILEPLVLKPQCLSSMLHGGPCEALGKPVGECPGHRAEVCSQTVYHLAPGSPGIHHMGNPHLKPLVSQHGVAEPETLNAISAVHVQIATKV